MPTPERNAVDVDFSARADDVARRDPNDAFHDYGTLN